MVSFNLESNKPLSFWGTSNFCVAQFFTSVQKLLDYAVYVPFLIVLILTFFFVTAVVPGKFYSKSLMMTSFGFGFEKLEVILSFVWWVTSFLNALLRIACRRSAADTFQRQRFYLYTSTVRDIFYFFHMIHSSNYKRTNFIITLRLSLPILVLLCTIMLLFQHWSYNLKIVNFYANGKLAYRELCRSKVFVEKAIIDSKCFKQKKGCRECSKVILLSADNRFCVQQLEANASPQKDFCIFSVRFAQIIFAVGKNEFLRFSFLQNDSKSKHAILRNLNDHMFLAYT